MQMNFTCSIDIDITSSKLKEISKTFSTLIQILLHEFFQQVLNTFAEKYMDQIKKPFICDRCANNERFIWKTHHGEPTTLLTIFGLLTLRQLQIQCKDCQHKMYLVRHLLGVAPRKRIPFETIRKLGLLGALASYRVAEKIVGMFGIVLDKMTIWRSVQKLGKELHFSIDPQECCSGEADGTGIPIRGIRKRGKEMKVFVQIKKKGGIRVAGLSLGNYDSGWDKLFKPLIPALKAFQQFLLVTDGDTSILKGLGDKVKIVFQRCLWHIPHQFKWYLWKDKVKRKSEEWVYALSQLMEIAQVKYVSHDKECIETIVAIKNEKLDTLIEFCDTKGWSHCTSYLKNAQPDMFTSFSNKLQGKTTSRVERVMKTINMRVNVGKWSPRGVLNAIKIRLAYYYNDFDVK